MRGRTEAEVMEEARGVDGACNASGVIRAMARATEDIWSLARARGLGTDWVNSHPALTLYVNKVMELNNFDWERLELARRYRPSAVDELVDAVAAGKEFEDVS